LKIIDDAVLQAAALTTQLLSFARRQVLPRGRTAPSQTLLHLAPLLERMLGSQISLEVDAKHSDWAAAMSAGQIEQIIMNLAANARDAMPQGGRLKIRVYDRALGAEEVPHLGAGDHIVVEVSDTGTGMSKEVCAQIFEPFYTTKGPGRGTGLGLATSFGIARQVGGTLTVESTPDVGSSFRLFLPRTAQPVSPDSEPLRAQRESARKLKVLVLDDEPRICELVARLLELAGHEAVTAQSSELALTRAAEQSFDAILTDVVLGREDGLDVLAQLRKLQPQASAVVMSGVSPSPERLIALRETGIGFLPKPFSLEALVGALTRRRA
jgi:CheY-like chemotaxis protein